MHYYHKVKKIGKHLELLHDQYQCRHTSSMRNNLLLKNKVNPHVNYWTKLSVSINSRKICASLWFTYTIFVDTPRSHLIIGEFLPNIQIEKLSIELDSTLNEIETLISDAKCNGEEDSADNKSMYSSNSINNLM